MGDLGLRIAGENDHCGQAREHLARFMELSGKHGVESTVIGEYNDSGTLRLDYRGKTCAFIRMDLLESDFPQWEFDAEWTPPEMRGLTEPVLTEPRRHGALLEGPAGAVRTSAPGTGSPGSMTTRCRAEA